MINWATVETLGVVGVLGVMLGLFVKGSLWPKAMVDRTIEAQQKAAEQSAVIIATEMKEGLKEAVRQGISAGLAEGFLRINVNNKD